MLISKNHNFDKDINIIVYFKIDTLSKQLMEIGLNKLEYIIKEQQYNLIIVLDKEIKMINDYIGILSDNFINEVNIYKQKSLLDKSINKVAIRNNYCNWVGGTKYINPNYFYFDIRKNYNYIYDKKIVDLLMNKFIQLVFAFTFNYTNNEQEKYYSFVGGYKKLKIDYIYIPDISVETCNYLKKIYEWIYSTDKIEEKIIIVRNIISIFLCDECSSSYYHLILNNSKEIYESIQINFEVYLEGNVKRIF